LQSSQAPLATRYRLRIGTRGSPLALVQAGQTRGLLAQALGITEDLLEIVPISTTGDQITDRPLSEAGGKGLFTKEIDSALLDGRIDLAVHSTKDVETLVPEGIVLAAYLERQDVRDAFLSPVAASLADLRAGASVGTSSLRRGAMVLHQRPDLKVVPMRGNVQTRLKKLADGVADATLLAQAGLQRLSLADRATSLIETREWLPAVGQGAIVISARAVDQPMVEALALLNHAPTEVAVTTERAFLAALDGSCRTPIGGLARVEDGTVSFRGIILKPDGSKVFQVERTGGENDAQAMGRDAGEELVARGGRDFFEAG
jgi:hydroxymethylbilane synthase